MARLSRPAARTTELFLFLFFKDLVPRYKTMRDITFRAAGAGTVMAFPSKPWPRKTLALPIKPRSKAPLG